MKKVLIVKGVLRETDWDDTFVPASSEAIEISDDDFTLLQRNLYRLDRYPESYKMFEIVSAEELLPLKERIATMLADERQAQAKREAANKKAAAERKAKELERKRKQLEKLKKELGDVESA